ncbi:MAG: hypothetical protein QM758_03810 [Armatimonas sp.]
MKELLTLAQANAIFGIALPLLGLVLGGAVIALRKDRRLAAFAGGVPVLAGVLWWVYNAISAALGIDTVLNLLVNFALFIALGAAIGWAWKKTLPPPLGLGQSDNWNSDNWNDGNAGSSVPVGVGPAGTPEAGRTITEAQEPPRNP